MLYFFTLQQTLKSITCICLSLSKHNHQNNYSQNKRSLFPLKSHSNLNHITEISYILLTHQTKKKPSNIFARFFQPTTDFCIMLQDLLIGVSGKVCCFGFCLNRMKEGMKQVYFCSFLTIFGYKRGAKLLIDR